MMKHFFPAFIVLLALSLTWISCGNEDDGSDPGIGLSGTASATIIFNGETSEVEGFGGSVSADSVVISSYGMLLSGPAQVISINSLGNLDASDFNGLSINIYQYAGVGVYNSIDPMNEEAGGVSTCSASGIALGGFANVVGFLYPAYSGDLQSVEVNITLDNADQMKGSFIVDPISFGEIDGVELTSGRLEGEFTINK